MRMKNTKRRRRGSDGSFWLSFSDLMSTLVMIFILILFYSMFQYFEMYEIKEAELARQQFDLTAANDKLAEEQEKLTEAEQQLIAQQIKLQAAEKGLTETEAILEQQKTELDNANSLLSQKETELNALSAQLENQQAALDSQQIQLNAQQLQLLNQQTQLENQQEQLEQLVGLRTQIIVALSEALTTHNITATVDPATGAIALESDVMFATGKSELSEAGKKSIDAFLPVYLNVLLSDEYRPYVSEIIVEGHTDSEGEYIKNLKLSQQRALAVASYILDDGYWKISARQKATLREIATANGRSYSDPVLVNGVEDRAASRRVVFKFRMTDEQMITQMQQILDQSAAFNEEAAASAEPSAAPDVTPEASVSPAPEATPIPAWDSAPQETVVPAP